jgi:hypothetical protein
MTSPSLRWALALGVTAIALSCAAPAVATVPPGDCCPNGFFCCGFSCLPDSEAPSATCLAVANGCCSNPQPCCKKGYKCCFGSCIPEDAQTKVACGPADACCKPPSPPPPPCCKKGYKCCGTGPAGCIPENTPTFVACDPDVTKCCPEPGPDCCPRGTFCCGSSCLPLSLQPVVLCMQPTCCKT